MKERFKRTDKNTLALFGLSIAIVVIMGILAPDKFLNVANFQSIAVQFPEFGILAFGMMMAMISGGIDLSLVGIANFSGIVAASVMIRMGGGNETIIVGILAALLIGLLCGIFNGFLIGYLQIPAMLVTLCGLQLYTGLGLIITKGPAITGLPEGVSGIVNGTILGIPYALIIFLIVALVVNYILKSTIYGKQVSYMGTNDTASKYSGINNLMVTIKTYGLSGILGGVAGILMLSHYNSAKSDYGTSYTLLSLLIVVLGNTDPNGGKGKVIGVSFAVILLQLVSSAFNVLRVNAFIKTFVWGLILIIILSISKIVANRTNTRKE